MSNAIAAKWKDVGPGHAMVLDDGQLQGRSKVLGFDLDWTLTKTKSGEIFPEHFDDWQLWDKSIPKKLKKCHDNGFKICIFTNQSGLQIEKDVQEAFMRKIQKLRKLIGVPMQVFVSIGPLNFRKPYVGMWALMENQYNDGVVVDREQCEYVGDAAGRTVTETKPKADHSCADRLFAMNLGVKFMTPEQFFLGSAAEEPYRLPTFDPLSVRHQGEEDRYDPPNASVPRAPTELVVLVGPPTSGKSALAARWADEHGYTVVSQEKLKTWPKCLKAAENALFKGESVIVDDSSGDPAARKHYVNLSKYRKVPCRCFVMQCSVEHALHNCAFHQILSPDDEMEEAREDAIEKFSEKFKPPTADEGFEEIVRVKFVANLRSEEEAKIYGMRLVEKWMPEE